MKKNIRIFAKTYTILFIILIILMVVMSFAGIRLLQKENQRNKLKEELRNISTKIENRVFLKLKGVSNSLATNEQATELLRGNTLTDNKDILLILETVKSTFDASIVSVMDRSGTVVASTVYEGTKSLTGKNYAFRPYFTGAMQGEDVIYPAVGVTTKRRGLYFSSPVYADNNDTPIGVVVIKVGLQELDSLLNALAVPAAVVSSEGIIFASNHLPWFYHSIYLLSSEKRASLKESRQFADIDITPLNWIFDNSTVNINDDWHYIVKKPFLSSQWQIILCEKIVPHYPLTESQTINVTTGFAIVITLIVIIFILITNIKRRKIAEHKIVASEKHLRTIMDTTIEGFWQIDKDAVTVDANPSMLNILGLERTDVVGKSFYEFLDDENAEILRNQLHIRQQGKHSTYELMLTRLDNKKVKCLVNATPLFDDDGNEVGSFAMINDITIRKRAEEALRGSENRYRLTIDAMEEFVYVVDRELRFCLYNTAFQKFIPELNISDDLYGKSIFEVFSFLPEKEVCKEYNEVFETGKTIVTQEEINIRGRTLWTDTQKIPILDDQGKIYRILTIVRDITKQKRAEDELRKREKRFRDITDNSLAWIWEVDAQGKYTYASPIVEKILGYTPEEIVGKKYFYDLFNPDIREEMKQIAFEAFAKKQPFREFENQNIHKDGKQVWLLTSGVPILDKKGNLLGYRGNDTDITERKRAEDALRESERKLSILMSNLPGIAYRCINDEAWTMQFISDGCKDLTGYDTEDIIHNQRLSYNDIIHPDDRKNVWAHVQEAVEKKEPFHLLYRIHTASNEEKWVWEQGVGIFSQEGALIALEGFITNITERILAEEELRKLKDNLEIEVQKKTKELLEAQKKLVQSERLAAMGQLGSTIAHEFRNQLGVMRNAAYFLKMKLKDGDEKIQKHLKILDDEIVQTDCIIENILTFVRTKEPALETVDAEGIIAPIIDKMRMKKPGDIEIKIEIEKNLPPISVDEVQMTQVFVNIITNAFEAIRGGGIVFIKVVRSGDMVNFVFEDTGPGIKNAIKEQIFEPLFTTKARGTGLGLATVKILVERHGGTVSVTSEEGMGSCFTIRLPIYTNKNEDTNA